MAKQRGAVNSSCQEKKDKAQQLEQTINILSKQLADISALTSTITNQAKHTSAKYASREASSNLLVLRGYSTSKDSKPYQEKVPRGKKPGSRRK